MTIKVIDQATGSTVEFPEGTPPETIKSVMGKFGKSQPGKPAEPEMSGWEAARRGAAQGLSLGFRDELYGAGKGAYDWATGGSFTEGYNKGTEESRALDRQASEASPAAFFAGEMAGGVAIPGVGFVKNAANLGLKARSLAAAKEGAAFGAAYGAGKGEGVEGKLEGAGTGFVTGGAVGGALPGLVDAGSAAIRGATRPLTAMIDPKRVASEKYAEAVARDHFVDGGTAAQAIQRGDNRLMQAQALETSPTRSLGGGDVMAADVGGENVRNLLRSAANIPSVAAEQMRKKVDSRQGLQWKRIENEIENGLGQGSKAFQSIDDLEAGARAAAGPLFQKAYATKLPMTEQLSEVLGRPHIRRLYELTVEQFANEGKDVAKMPPLQVLHAIKMQIDRQIGQVKRGIQDSKANWDARTLVTLKNDLKGAIDVPEYQQALRTYSGPMAVRNALEDGMDDALREAPELITKKLGKLSGAEKAAYRMGAARSLLGQIRKGNVNRDRTESMFGSPDMQMRLKALYPNQKSLRRLQARLVLEAKMADTRKAIQGNSTTAKQLAQGDEAGQPVRALQATMAAVGGKLEPIMNYLSRQAQRLNGLTPAVADELIRMGMSKTPQSSRAWKRALARAEKDPAYLAKIVQRLISSGLAGLTQTVQETP